MSENTAISSMCGDDKATIDVGKSRPEFGDVEAYSYLSGPLIFLTSEEIDCDFHMLPIASHSWFKQPQMLMTTATFRAVRPEVGTHPFTILLGDIEKSNDDSNCARQKIGDKVHNSNDIRDVVKAHQELRNFYKSLYENLPPTLAQYRYTFNDSDFRVKDQPPMTRLFQIPCGQDLILSRSTSTRASTDSSSTGKVVFASRGEGSGVEVEATHGGGVLLTFCPRLMLSEQDGIVFMCATIHHNERPIVTELKTAIEERVKAMLTDVAYQGLFKDHCRASSTHTPRTTEEPSGATRQRAAVVYTDLFRRAVEAVVDSSTYDLRTKPIKQEDYILSAGH